jgi:hypothetical protein
MKDEAMIMKMAEHMPHKFPPVTEHSNYVDPEGLSEQPFTRSMTKAEMCYYLANADYETYQMYVSLWLAHLEARASTMKLLSTRKKLIKANYAYTVKKMKV